MLVFYWQPPAAAFSAGIGFCSQEGNSRIPESISEKCINDLPAQKRIEILPWMIPSISVANYRTRWLNLQMEWLETYVQHNIQDILNYLLSDQAKFIFHPFAWQIYSFPYFCQEYGRLWYAPFNLHCHHLWILILMSCS